MFDAQTLLASLVPVLELIWPLIGGTMIHDLSVTGLRAEARTGYV